MAEDEVTEFLAAGEHSMATPSPLSAATAAAALNQASRMGERLAALEAASVTRMAGFSEDLRVVRQNLHDIRGQMQISMAAEQRCISSLAVIERIQSEQDTAARHRSAEHAAQIDKIMAALERIAADRARAEGAWWFATKAAAAIAALLGAGWWAITHLAVRS